VELIFIRHGQPQWEIDGTGVDDPVLTELGHRQAALLPDVFTDRPIDRLVVSPLIRAGQTAAPLIDAFGLEPEVHDWIAEIRAPVWQGTPSEVIERAFAEQRSRPLREQWEAIPGAESFLEFHRRVVGGLTDFLTEIGCVRTRGFPPLWDMQHEGPRIVFVAHSGANAVSLGHLLGIEPVPWEWERFVAFHASVSVVRPMHIASSLSFSLFRFSDTSHLPNELHTR